MAGVDPIKLEVMRGAFSAVTEEMAVVLRRTAYSTNVKTRQDFSCALFDSEMRTIAQAFTQPIHLGSFYSHVPRAIERFGKERLGPGDMILSNDPFGGGVHLNDITLIGTVYDGDRLLGYTACLAHHVDVGGGAPASVGAFKEVFQEGVIIPAVRLVEGGEIVDDVFRLVMAQIRSKRETAGDFRAQVSANLTGEKRLGEIVARYGRDTVRRYSDALLDYTERRTREALARLPRGIFKASGFVDSDGYSDDPVHLEVTVGIDDDGVAFDLTGCDEQRRAPVNSTYAQTFSACAYALRAVIDDDDIPVNDGFYRFVRPIAPEGTVVNALHPAPVVGGWETQVRVNDLIFKALAPAFPDVVAAGTKAMQCHAGFGGTDPRRGEYYCFLETLAGGYGGRSGLDGPDAVQTHGQNTENAPVEEIEANYPLRIERYELIADSEGPGAHRGGLGLRRDYTFLHDDVTFTVLADRERAGPHGLFGGLPGMPARYVLDPGPNQRVLSSKTTIDLDSGRVVSFQTCGGGGYGPPVERDPELVARDVRQRRISRDRASSVYGVALDEAGRVALDEAGRVDPEATAELRRGPDQVSTGGP